MNLNSKMIIS